MWKQIEALELQAISNVVFPLGHSYHESSLNNRVNIANLSILHPFQYITELITPETRRADHVDILL